MVGTNRTPAWLLGLVVLGAIVVSSIGCQSDLRSPSQGVTSLGQPPTEDAPQQTAGSLADDLIGKTVAVEGKIVQQCPSTGCWFRVKDDTGEIFVDLNPAGLTLREKRVGSQARVTGRLAKIGKQFRLEAQFVEFKPLQPAPNAERQDVGTGSPPGSYTTREED